MDIIIITLLYLVLLLLFISLIYINYSYKYIVAIIILNKLQSARTIESKKNNKSFILPSLIPSLMVFFSFCGSKEKLE